MPLPPPLPPNNLNINPMFIDQNVSAYKAAILAQQGQPLTLTVEKIYWENPATPGDAISIVDPVSGLELASLFCDVAGKKQVIDWTKNPRVWMDFSIPAYPSRSGQLYIYTR